MAALGVREVELTAVLTATFAANLPANNKVTGTIQLDPAYAAQALLTVPLGESWVVEDLFVSATQTPDSILELLRNLLESKFRSAPINGLIVTNPARPIPSPVLFDGGDMMSIVAQNLAAVGASAQTITVFLKIRRFASKV